MADLWGCSCYFREQSQQPPGQNLETIDQSDIRGSKPYNRDPPGVASDYSGSNLRHRQEIKVASSTRRAICIFPHEE